MDYFLDMLPWWAMPLLIIGIVIVVIFWMADPLAEISRLIKRLMDTHTFKSADRTIGGSMRTKIGKRIIVGALICTVGFLGWKLVGSPFIQFATDTAVKSAQNNLLNSAYANIPIGEECITSGKPYTRTERLIDITAVRKDKGNSRCFYVDAKNEDAGMISLSFMQFTACEDQENNWSYTKETLLKGEFIDDVDYRTSAELVAQHITNSCTAESLIVAQKEATEANATEEEDSEKSPWYSPKLWVRTIKDGL